MVSFTHGSSDSQVAGVPIGQRRASSAASTLNRCPGESRPIRGDSCQEHMGVGSTAAFVSSVRSAPLGARPVRLHSQGAGADVNATIGASRLPVHGIFEAEYGTP